MTFEADDEILNDFIVEAGEILDQLSEQLIDLEKNPGDESLLNTIFRGFHTIKGGAGFLNLLPLVEICHITENVFDALKRGETSFTPKLMDCILKALDYVNKMFAEVKDKQFPNHVPETFLKKLSSFSGEIYIPRNQKVQKPMDNMEMIDNMETKENKTDINEEFQEVLQQKGKNNDEITDDEFEALLDELHGQGNPVSSKEAAQSSDKKETATPSKKTATSNSKARKKTVNKKAPEKESPNTEKKEDSISNDEFEALLQELNKNQTEPEKKQSTKPHSESKSDNKTRVLESHKKTTEEKEASKEKEISKPIINKSVEKSPTNKPKSLSMTAESTVRVDTSRLDEIMNMVGELVLARNRLKMLSHNSNEEKLIKAVGELDVVTSDLQGAVMKTRMQPIKKVFGRFPRVVRDLARSLKKEVALELLGEDTDLDKNLVEALADPLIHLVRNAVDHGIEIPEERVKLGKSRTGKIILSAKQEGDHILLSIKDDGKGMNAHEIKKKIIKMGLMEKEYVERMSDSECFNVIFTPGFSMKEEISDVSGRGVGMDVVKTKITQLNGSLTIDSVVNAGTTILIKVPLTLAILPTLMVSVGGQSFALPLASVNEIFHLDLNSVKVVDGQEVIIIRDKALPLFHLENWLRPKRVEQIKNKNEEAHIVLVQMGTQTIGFVVDALFGQEEVVIKPLGESLQGTPGMAGATITSDGGIALILDIPSLLEHYAKK